jgi:hypothetical protein
MGSGIIDFSKIFNYLKINRNTTPIITIEPHGESELWSSLEYLANVWPW